MNRGDGGGESGECVGGFCAAEGFEGGGASAIGTVVAAMDSSLAGSVGVVFEIAEAGDDVVADDGFVVGVERGEEMLQRGRAADSAEGLRRRGANAPEGIGVQRGGESGDDFVVIFDFAEGDRGVGAVGEFGGVLELVEPLFLFLVKIGGFQEVAAFVEEDHERRRSPREGEGFGGFA